MHLIKLCMLHASHLHHPLSGWISILLLELQTRLISVYSFAVQAVGPITGFTVEEG